AEGEGVEGEQSPTRTDPAREENRLAQEVLLTLPAGLTPAAVRAAGYRVIAEHVNRSLGGRTLRLGLPPGRSLEAARAELAALVPGGTADANHLYRPDDFLCPDGDCAAHEAIGWSGWPSALSPKIGMIDTGVNADHDALRGARLTVVQEPLGGRDPAGRQHGTAVASLLVGQVGSRAPGLLPYAELIAVEAFFTDSGTAASDAYTLAAAVDRLIAEGVSVINLSFSGPPNAVLEDVTRRAAAAGVGLVAAAGNGGAQAGPAYPAAWPHVIAVTAVDKRNRAYRLANRGPYVALAAPGVGVWAAASISGGRPMTGTSFAVPFVTAALAVERLRMGDKPVQATIDRLLACAQDLGEAGRDPVYGAGLLTAPGQCTADAAPPFTAAGAPEAATVTGKSTPAGE
ncbi:MAG TPA: S8 family serine peptidase, partial [Paracoccaceae bacterium]|nr:S8 family serine peptidase [Paracoccaceae bacterium]